ncbi:BirA family biotin operon repressor/biotin-[acetyl-CoA-carboxylase] ligase [Desulfitispora alkaliphila]|uniref:biotin--[acetyl-CoA-carboxylase] ligase n=1 Tax=Desulfitispora alkaliphila TaxID=622674 RepID=UPI003D21B4D8
MKQKILELLKHNKGTPISGEDISVQLGVSRTAIWKQINSLKAEGYLIESKSRRGYMLVEAPDILYPPELKIKLGDSIFSRDIHYKKQVDSTNTWAKRLADEGALEGSLAIAEEQTGGRGRRGRAWHSADQKGIWMSVVLRPKIPPTGAAKLTFVAAVAVVKAVKNVTGVELGIKWPNDLYYQGKKVCGILTEMKAEVDLIDYVIIGMGVNVNQEAVDFPEELNDIATSVALASGQRALRQDIAAQILLELEREYVSFVGNGFESTLKRWQELDLTYGKEVLVQEFSHQYTGIAQGVDADGSLLVETEKGRKAVSAGDVSIRVAK